MEQIIKENGNVYLVKWHDIDGKHITKTFLGKEYIEEEEKPSKKRKRKKKEDD